MALTLGDNFSYQGAKPLDQRLKYSTVAAMKSVADATMYDGCLAYCTATDTTYQWKSTNTVDSTLGKWREFSSGDSGVELTQSQYDALSQAEKMNGKTYYITDASGGGGGGGASALSELTDTTISSPSNNQVLTYDSTTSKWKNADAQAGSSSLSGLTDVTITSATSGQVLKNDGTKWVNGDVPSDTTKQPKTLATPLVIDGENITTVENALDALNNKNAGNVSTATLNFAFNTINQAPISANQSKFYVWSHSGLGSTITNYYLPELNTTTFPYRSYNAFIVLSADDTGGIATVFYDYVYDENAQGTSVTNSRFTRSATQKLVKDNGVFKFEGAWHYNNSNVANRGDVDFSTEALDIMNIAIEGKTVFYTGIMSKPTARPYFPIPQTGTLSGVYRYTYFITKPAPGLYNNIYLQCFVTNSAAHGGDTTRLFSGVYCYSSGEATPYKWIEIGGSEIDTTKIYTTDDTAETALADADYVPFYDTSATAKRKTLWSNIKSVLKTYFDTVYSGIFTNATELAKIGEQNGVPTYDGQIISLPTISHFDKSNILSTTEKVVGCYTDGKPMYQRTVNYGTLPNNSDKAVAHGISNIDKIISYDFTWRDSSGGTVVSNGSFMSTITNLSSYDLVGVWLDKTSIFVQTRTDRSSFSGVCTIKYTKTTDAANSFNYASENDYSTSETIVGKWLNGETLYQRTWTGTVPNGNASVGTFVSGATPVEMRAFVKITGYGVPIPYDATPASNKFTNPYISFSDNKIYINALEPGHVGGTFYITIKYTKS